MASNFDFLKDVDKELFFIAKDGEKLFRDEYFNQSVVQFRIYAEKMAKNILNSNNSELTFDTMLNNLKDKITTQREKEFVEDLFFIKQEGNKCAHGESANAISVLEVIKRAFEAGINYAFKKTKDENTDKLIFDEKLLITEIKSNEPYIPQKQNKSLIDKYLKLVQKENLPDNKQEEFLSYVDKIEDESNVKNKSYIKNKADYKQKIKKKTKELTPLQKKIKNKVKEQFVKTKTKNSKEKTKKEFFKRAVIYFICCRIDYITCTCNCALKFFQDKPCLLKKRKKQGQGIKIAFLSLLEAASHEYVREIFNFPHIFLYLINYFTVSVFILE